MRISRMRRETLVLVAIVAAFWTFAAHAEGEESGSTSLEERVEALERAQDAELTSDIKTEKANYYPSRGWLQGMAYGLRDIDVEVHGFLNLEYVDAQSDGSRGGRSTFDLHHANVFFDAILRPNLRAHLEVEFEHGGEKIEIDQGYMAWGATDWLTLTAGRFYAPFGIERFVWYAPVNKMISRPMPFRDIVPGNFYQQGLMISGDLGPSEKLRFTYELSVSNGLGENADSSRRGSRQVRDNNHGKAVTARVASILWPWAELGASVHFQDDYDDAAGSNQDLLFVGVDGSGRWRGFELRGEYVYANLERAAATRLHQKGWYVQLSYLLDFEREFLPSLSLVGRIDDVDLDDDVTGNDDKTRFALGTNLEIYEHFRTKLEYQFNTERGPNLKDDTVLAQFVLDF